MEGLMDYTARFDATAIGREIDFVLTVIAGVTTLCPCSKAISQYGAHNQRGMVTVQIRSKRAVWIEDLIALVESSASAELYSLLKRQDEKAVTERAYDNPVFVEDLVRNVAQVERACGCHAGRTRWRPKTTKASTTTTLTPASKRAED